MAIHRNIIAQDRQDNTAQELPPGIPRVVDTNGNIVFINHKFTTDLYQKEALKLTLEEANKVAKELNLPEELPITESNLVEFHISPFGFAYSYKMIGGITTKNYAYYVAQGDKFNDLTVADYDQFCLKLKSRGTLPIAELNTNAAYELATQWLAAVSMDVKQLNQNCKVHVALTPFWNDLTHLGEKPKNQFVPIYFIWWTSPENDIQKSSNVAYVELFAPTKTLLQLSVSNPKYILRKPLIFTNLAALFPGIMPVHTNHPVKTIYLSAPPS